MHVATELTLFLAKTPKSMATVLEALEKANINICACMTSDNLDHLVVRLVPDDPHKATRVLEEGGALVTSHEVVVMETHNQPGSASSVLQHLAQARIGIHYLYFAAARVSTRGILIIRPVSLANAVKVLNQVPGADGVVARPRKKPSAGS